MSKLQSIQSYLKSLGLEKEEFSSWELKAIFINALEKYIKGEVDKKFIIDLAGFFAGEGNEDLLDLTCALLDLENIEHKRSCLVQRFKNYIKFLKGELSFKQAFLLEKENCFTKKKIIAFPYFCKNNSSYFILFKKGGKFFPYEVDFEAKNESFSEEIEKATRNFTQKTGIAPKNCYQQRFFEPRKVFSYKKKGKIILNCAVAVRVKEKFASSYRFFNRKEALSRLRAENRKGFLLLFGKKQSFWECVAT